MKQYYEDLTRVLYDKATESHRASSQIVAKMPRTKPIMRRKRGYILTTDQSDLLVLTSAF
eukprot:9502213-Pyramimonas_sp.AAC.2